MAYFKDLPQELVREVVQHVDDRRDVKSLTLVCKSLNGAVTERLYQNIQDESFNEPETTKLVNITRLLRTLTQSDFPHQIRKLVIDREKHGLQPVLTNLVAPSLQILRSRRTNYAVIDDFDSIPTLPFMPFLKLLDISEVVLRKDVQPQTFRQLPSLRHLRILFLESPDFQNFGLLIESVPNLTRLQIDIEEEYDDSVGDGKLPFGLAGALGALKHTLEDLSFVDTHLDRPYMQGCLDGRVGSFEDFSRLQRLAIPLERLIYDDLAVSPENLEHQFKTAVGCLPTSLQELGLQFSHSWIDRYVSDFDKFLDKIEAGSFDYTAQKIQLPPNSENHDAYDDEKYLFIPLFVIIRAIIREIHQYRPVLRTVMLWYGQDIMPEIHSDVLEAMFRKFMPTEEELQPLKIRLLFSHDLFPLDLKHEFCWRVFE